MPSNVPYAKQFNAAGTKYGISPTLLAAQALVESINFNKDVIACRRHSPKGAMGISQFLPGTAKHFGINPCIPEQAIDGQARYMRNALAEFKDVDMALAAYNAGTTKVRQLGRVPRFKETLNYIKRIHQHQAQMEAN